MESPVKMLKTPEILSAFKFLEIERKNGEPKIRGQISAVVSQSTDQRGDLSLKLNYYTQQCLGNEAWINSDSPLPELQLTFDYQQFKWLGLNACPMLIILDHSGHEYLFFKDNDEYVKANPGFKN